MSKSPSEYEVKQQTSRSSEDNNDDSFKTISKTQMQQMYDVQASPIELDNKPFIVLDESTL